MPVTRHVFKFSKVSLGTTALTDTGGRKAFGTVEQLRWQPSAQDTGPGPIGTITVWAQDEKTTDTGLAHVIFNEASVVIGNDIVRSLADTGTARNTKIILGGEVLKARILPSDTGAIDGSLYVYVSD